jgi:hypothetical protein
LNSITNLSADFQMLEGTFANGSPRFTIFDNTNNPVNAAYVYFGTPNPGGTFSDPNPGAAESTGNYASNSPDLRVQVNGFNGDSTGALPYISWDDFVSRDGTALIAYITIDLDGGYTPATAQQMQVTAFNVTAAAAPGAAPLPAALPLFVSGAGALGVLGWRRKKKAVAA